MGAIQQSKNRCSRAAVWRGLGWELLAPVPVDGWKKGKWAGIQREGETPLMCMCSLYVPESVCVNRILPSSVPVWTCVFCWDTVSCCGCSSSAGAGAGVVVQRWKTSASCDHSPSWSVKVLAIACIKVEMLKQQMQLSTKPAWSWWAVRPQAEPRMEVTRWAAARVRVVGLLPSETKRCGINCRWGETTASPLKWTNCCLAAAASDAPLPGELLETDNREEREQKPGTGYTRTPGPWHRSCSNTNTSAMVMEAWLDLIFQNGKFKAFWGGGWGVGVLSS